MSSQPPSLPEFLPVNGYGRRLESWARRRRGGRWIWNIVLLVLTAGSTTMMGALLVRDFQENLPPFSSTLWDDFVFLLERPSLLLAGLTFSLPLLLILLAHEMGHYLACRFYRIDASLPYFLPAPTLIGTFGAFIRIRSPIYSRFALFDVGIAGPLAGFLFLLPAFTIGLAYSKILPGIAERGDLIFGAPLLQRMLEFVVFPGVDPSDIYLHPVARAAWVGVLATSLNLLPIGQLDGGHILYSLVGERHRWLSRVFLAALVPVGIFYSYSWLVWALFLLLFGMRHPMIYDPTRLGRGRMLLGGLSLLIFVLSFTPTPVRIGDGL